MKPILKVPSDFSDKYFKAIWGENFEHSQEFFEVFGCPNGENGEVVDCKDPFVRWFHSMFWNCNTRNFFNQVSGFHFFCIFVRNKKFFLKIWNRYQADFDAFNYGKFYAIVNDIPNCDSDTKTCHCANKNWLSLSKTGNDLITSKNIELEKY